ncbi:hypothetical protein GW820_04800 [archaeon]|nr:hypothetical protein [archaeon]
MGQICTGIHVCYVFVYITIATAFEETVVFEQDFIYDSKTVIGENEYALEKNIQACESSSAFSILKYNINH